MEGFSFAYMQEAFVATLLALARDHTSIVKDDGHDGGSDGGSDDDDDDLDQYEFWRVMVEQVKILREDMGGRNSVSHGLPNTSTNEAYLGLDETTPLMSAVGALNDLDLGAAAGVESREQQMLARMQRFSGAAKETATFDSDGSLGSVGLGALPDLTGYGGQNSGVGLAGNVRRVPDLRSFSAANRDRQAALGYFSAGIEGPQWFGTHGVGVTVLDAVPVGLGGDQLHPGGKADSRKQL